MGQYDRIGPLVDNWANAEEEPTHMGSPRYGQDRSTRRARLWLKKATWDAIDAASKELHWNYRPATVIERVLDEWACAQLALASAAARRYDQRDGTTTQDELAALAAGVHTLGYNDPSPDWLYDDTSTPESNDPASDRQ